MKALSLTPPWHVAILDHGKRVENRTAWTACSYRGPILLHAAKGIGSRDDFDARARQILSIVDPDGASDDGVHFIAAALDLRDDPRGLVGSRWAPGKKLHRGGIVGRAEIVDVIKPAGFDAWVARGETHAMHDFDGAGTRREDQRKWWFGGFALVLDKVEALPFVPWKGALGLFEVPDDYASRAA